MKSLLAHIWYFTLYPEGQGCAGEVISRVRIWLHWGNITIDAVRGDKDVRLESSNLGGWYHEPGVKMGGTWTWASKRAGGQRRSHGSWIRTLGDDFIGGLWKRKWVKMVCLAQSHESEVPVCHQNGDEWLLGQPHELICFERTSLSIFPAMAHMWPCLSYPKFLYSSLATLIFFKYISHISCLHICCCMSGISLNQLFIQ